MADDAKPFHNPFTAALGGMRARMPESPAPAQASPPPESSAKSVKPVPRAVVRMERAGRGGKEVTVVEHLEVSAADREVWLKALKAALGCGGSIEGASIMLQGDHRDRLPGLLAARGVKKVTVG